MGDPASAVIEGLSASLKPWTKGCVCVRDVQGSLELEGRQAQALIWEWDALAGII